MNFNEICFNLAKSILLIESKKEKITFKQCKKILLCYCKNKIIEEYLTNCQLLLIKITSLILKYNETKDDEKFNIYIDEMHNWFLKNNYTNLYNNKEISFIGLKLFEIIQIEIDKKLFKFIKENLLNNVKVCINREEYFNENNKNCCLAKLYSDLCKWFELVLFSSISISNLDCLNFKEEIFNEENLNFYNSDNNSLDYFKKVNSNCNLINNGKEYIKIIYTDEIIDDNYDIYYNLLEILIKYHKKYKDIKIIFDFLLIDNKIILNDIIYKTFKLAIENFNHVEIVNYDNIDFGKYYDDVKLFLVNKEQINNNKSEN